MIVIGNVVVVGKTATSIASTAHEQHNMTDVSSEETVPSSGWCANIHVLCKRILIFSTDLLEVLPIFIVNAFLSFELFIAAITIYLSWTRHFAVIIVSIETYPSALSFIMSSIVVLPSFFFI